MRPTIELFALWKRVRDRTLTRVIFARRMQPIRAEIGALLLAGYYNPLTAGVCKELVAHRANLWTFVDTAGVEPTNNAAVIWRKLSFGTQSAAGSRFVERMLTVIETTRRQMPERLRVAHRRRAGQAGRTTGTYTTHRGVNRYMRNLPGPGP
jgi:hypothetical protein